MADLTLSQIFGSDASVHNEPDNNRLSIEFSLDSFKNEADGGEIKNGLGFDDPWTLDTNNINQKTTQVFYALILLILQNQAENINADPTQKIFINKNPAGLGSGSREGQVRNSFTINFFSPTDAANLPDIDHL